jgi:hypothetical protein
MCEGGLGGRRRGDLLGNDWVCQTIPIAARRSVMSMVGGLDLHRGQITFDVVSTETGEVWRGRVGQPTRLRFRH